MLRYQMSRWEQNPVEIYHLLFIDKAVSQTEASQEDGPGFDSQLVAFAFHEADHVTPASLLTNRTTSLTEGLSEWGLSAIPRIVIQP